MSTLQSFVSRIGQTIGKSPLAHHPIVVLWVATRIAFVTAAAGIVIGVAVDSFLGAILAPLDAKRLWRSQSVRSRRPSRCQRTPRLSLARTPRHRHGREDLVDFGVPSVLSLALIGNASA